MTVLLNNRTEANVRIYFEKSQQPEIKSMLPQKVKSIEEALVDYMETQRPGAASYGRTIYVNGKYIGDVWCYCIDKDETPNAMLSFCVFEKNFGGKGLRRKPFLCF